MGKRQNYGFEKRQKEVKKQKKKDEKAEKKRLRREEAAEQEASSEGGAETDEESDQPTARRDAASPGLAVAAADLDPELEARVHALCEAGWKLWARFDRRVRQREFHPFVAADYQMVLEALLPLRAPGLKFLEWGSATGVITIMADLLGFEAYGIELDRELVDEARELARTTGSGARFVAGSFLPAGYKWRDRDGDERLGTIGQGESGYLQLGMPLEDFDMVFGYPWPGEDAMMIDLMRVHGRRDARFLLHGAGEIRVYRGGRASA